MARRLHGKRFKVRLVNHGDDSDDGGGGDPGTRVTERLPPCAVYFLKMHNGRARAVCVCVSVRTRESSD